MSLTTLSNLQPVIPEPRTYIYFSRVLKHLEDVNTLFDNSINVFHAMMFAANQEHNETYNFKDMLRHDDCQQLIDKMMVEVNAHEDRDHWNLIKRKKLPRRII